LRTRKELILIDRMKQYNLWQRISNTEGEGLVWLIGAVVCLLAAAAGLMSVSTGSG